MMWCNTSTEMFSLKCDDFYRAHPPFLFIRKYSSEDDENDIDQFTWEKIVAVFVHKQTNWNAFIKIIYNSLQNVKPVTDDYKKHYLQPIYLNKARTIVCSTWQ